MSSEANKALIRRYFDQVHNQRDVSVLEDLFAPTRGAVDRFQRAFPDYQITIVDQVTEADKVATV